MLNVHFSPFPTLSTSRLCLRQLDNTDLAAVLALYSNVDVMRYIPRPLAQNTSDAQAIIDRINGRLIDKEGINWAITHSQQPNYTIGIIGYMRIMPEHYRAEVGYMLHPDYHRQGIMQEALVAVLQYGFEVLHLHSVEAILAPKNLASERLLQHNGFVKEAHFKEKEKFDGRYIDSMVYSLLQRNWQLSHPATTSV
ncbi:MAG: GNAT family N-acetyltransferase [Sphingobacteriales bacterium]|nr:GNAT family N-acetyltransferase [Sphingobacteriales bacterium]MCC7223297.1 GNAT family N-acetyltransferase [Chitinophagales bacterium]